MITYISILRGINVNGKHIIKMEALKNIYQNLHFQKVHTYIQSGNVIFMATETDVLKLEELITNAIETVFGFSIPVIVFTKPKLEEIVHQNPFLKMEKVDPNFLHITFLKEQPITLFTENIIAKKQQGEDIIFHEKAIYLYCPYGYGKTKLHNSFLEQQLKVVTTTRNWKTALELLKIATNI